MNTVVELFLEGASRKEIADILQRDYSSICKQLQRCGITKRREMMVHDQIRARGFRTRYSRDADRQRVDPVAPSPLG